MSRLSQAAYLQWQVVIEAGSIMTLWIAVLFFWFDIATIKEFVVVTAVIDTLALLWWLVWERARLPNESDLG